MRHSGCAVCNQLSIHSHTLPAPEEVVVIMYRSRPRRPVTPSSQTTPSSRHITPYRTAQVELAQGRHVYDADLLADVQNFGGGVAVVVGADPVPRHQRLRPVALVPGLHRGVPHRLEDTSGQGPQRNRTVRGPPHGGPSLSDGAPRGLSHNSHGVDGLEFALCRAHGYRGVALDQLYGIVALLLGSDEVLGGDILGIVHDAVRAAAEQGRVLVDGQLRDLLWRRLRRWFLLEGLRDAGVLPSRGLCGPPRGFPAGGACVGELLIERPIASYSATRQHVVGEGRREEAGSPFVVDRAVASHVHQGGGRGPADGRDEQVALYLSAVGALHGADAPTTLHAHDVSAPAGVDDAGDLDASAREVFCCLVAALVRREDDHPLPRLDGVEIDQSPGGTREDDSRSVIALEDVGTLDEARRDH